MRRVAEHSTTPGLADRLLALGGSLFVHGIAVAAIVAYTAGESKDGSSTPQVITLAMEWVATPAEEGSTADSARQQAAPPSPADEPAADSVPSAPAIETTARAEDPAPTVEPASPPQDIQLLPRKTAVAITVKPTPPKPDKEAIQADGPTATLSDLTTLAALDVSEMGHGTSAAPSSGPNADQPRSWSILSRPAPRYPMTARRRGSEGDVALRVDIDRDGKPRMVTIARSSGDPQLDDAAAQAVIQWRFAAGAPMAIEIPIQFRLRADNLAANQP